MNPEKRLHAHALKASRRVTLALTVQQYHDLTAALGLRHVATGERLGYSEFLIGLFYESPAWRAVEQIRKTPGLAKS